MARKPRSEWSPTYRARIERGEAKGKTPQQARGHRAGEHIQRKEGKGLAPSLSARVDRFARQQARRAGSGDPDQAVRLLKAWTREHGARRFDALDRRVKRHEREKRERQTTHVRHEGGGRVTLHISTGPGVAALANEFEEFDLPDMPDGDDFGWLFYH
jgi:hypothetical protein